MRVLVLGATGGVGRLVAEEALKREHELTVLVRSPRSSPSSRLVSELFRGTLST